MAVHVEHDAGQTVTACDVLVQNCPNSVEACFPFASGAACAPAGTRGEGAPCAKPNDCNGGFTCSGGAASVCQRLCAPNGATNTCGEGQTCSSEGRCTPPGSYSACLVSAGLDHVTVFHSEPARRLCTELALSSPGTNTRAALYVTPGWDLQGASVSHRDGGCPPGFIGTPGALAQDASGRIELFVPDGGFLPDQLDALVTLSLPPAVGVPTQVTVQVSGLALQSCF